MRTSKGSSQRALERGAALVAEALEHVPVSPGAAAPHAGLRRRRAGDAQRGTECLGHDRVGAKGARSRYSRVTMRPPPARKKRAGAVRHPARSGAVARTRFLVTLVIRLILCVEVRKGAKKCAEVRRSAKRNPAGAKKRPRSLRHGAEHAEGYRHLDCIPRGGITAPATCAPCPRV